MQTPKPKIIVLVGPTSSGKSDLGVHLAKKFNGEIISADSRQVYKGMDLGSGKITKKEMAGIPHHLLDVADPKRVFSASRYQKLAQTAIKKVIKNKKVPLIVGGTGFYVRSIIDGLVLPSVPPNAKLRQKLEKKTVAQLFKILQKLDLARAKVIDRNNPHRLIRSIEVAKALGKMPTLETTDSPYDFLQIGLLIDFKKLEEKIRARLAKRLRAGMLAEVKNLHKQGVSWKRLGSFGLEYKHCALHLQGKETRAEMSEGIVRESLQYAKRQMTWFKKNQRITWTKTARQAEQLVKNFLK